VGLAGFAGALARFGVGHLFKRMFDTSFPIGTMFINVSGCFVLGWFLAFAGQRANIGEATRLAVAVGFLGAYTTFSTWAYDTNALAEGGMGFRAGLNLVLSVVLGLAAVRLGAACAKAF
jgi:CrcB protein